jgi:hypothetical protein
MAQHALLVAVERARHLGRSLLVLPGSAGQTKTPTDCFASIFRVASGSLWPLARVKKVVIERGPDGFEAARAVWYRPRLVDLNAASRQPIQGVGGQ